MANTNYDFSGWATRNDIRCADGRTIRRDAFKECDGITVPLVWSHRHDSNEYVLGHALLENREEGVYCYGTFNDTELAKKAKAQVINKDITSLSIYANHLEQDSSKNVTHGMIREVSLVLAGANPAAYIDFSMAHSDEESDSLAGVVYNPIENLIVHSEEEQAPEETKEEGKEATMENENQNQNAPEETVAHAETEEVVEHAESEETIQDILDTMNEKQMKVVEILVGEALAQNSKEKPEEEKDMAHNVFETEKENEQVLSHSEVEAIFADAQRCGSLKDACLAHSVTDIGYLYPDNKNVTTEPSFITRDMTWVQKVMGAVHHTPFSRIKSLFANVTADEARAKGYLTKGTQKIEEVILLLKRTTDPTTVYKLQKFDRDDVLDITDFDVVAWIKKEMRMLLDEEIARAILVGDGRSNLAQDKIDATKIRPIWTDADLFTVKYPVEYAVGDTDAAKVKKFIQACVRARKSYKGSGNPVLFTTEDVLNDCLLMEDVNGRVIYETTTKLATALRVSDIVTVPVMEGLTRVEGEYTYSLLGLVVNMADYNVGADKGGAISMFDDFNIDYNKYEYLIETRVSGALTKPYSAIAVELKTATAEAQG